MSHLTFPARVAAVAGVGGLLLAGCHSTPGAAPGSASATPASSSPVAASGSGALLLPDAKKLGPGWSRAVAGANVAGLFAPCGTPVVDAKAHRVSEALTGPGGWRVLIETAAAGADATPVSAASQAVTNCPAPADPAGGTITIARLDPISGLRSSGAHIETDRGASVVTQDWWVAGSGPVVVSVLVTSPAPDQSVGGDLDTFSAQLAAAADKAATGQVYGPLTTPLTSVTSTDGTSPSTGDAPSGSTISGSTSTGSAVPGSAGGDTTTVVVGGDSGSTGAGSGTASGVVGDPDTMGGTSAGGYVDPGTVKGP